MKKTRKDLVPKLCSRCGNFLWNGNALFWLPYEKRYVVFCEICTKGLELDKYFHRIPMTEDDLERFWNTKLNE